jgi:hypothetical protein
VAVNIIIGIACFYRIHRLIHVSSGYRCWCRCCLGSNLMNNNNNTNGLGSDDRQQRYQNENISIQIGALFGVIIACLGSAVMATIPINTSPQVSLIWWQGISLTFVARTSVSSSQLTPHSSIAWPSSFVVFSFIH